MGGLFLTMNNGNGMRPEVASPAERQNMTKTLADEIAKQHTNQDPYTLAQTVENMAYNQSSTNVYYFNSSIK